MSPRREPVRSSVRAFRSEFIAVEALKNIFFFHGYLQLLFLSHEVLLLRYSGSTPLWCRLTFFPKDEFFVVVVDVVLSN